MTNIIDTLVNPKSKPQILYGGPDKFGSYSTWHTYVEYQADGLVGIRLSPQEVRDWCKRLGCHISW